MSSRCLNCDQDTPTETVFLRFHSSGYEGRVLVKHSVDVRCRCCRRCRRRIIWADRLRRYHFALFVFCTVAMVALYVLCVPLLVRLGIQKALVGAGFVAPGIAAWFLAASIVRASTKDLISDAAIERLRTPDVNWQPGPQSYVTITDEPEAAFVDLCQEDTSPKR